MHQVKYTFKASQVYETVDWKGEVRASWNQLFAAVAPLMINESSEDALKLGFSRVVEQLSAPFRLENKELQGWSQKSFVINDADFQTIKIQLRALGLIARSEKARSVKDTATYWTLTPYGDELMTRLRAIS